MNAATMRATKLPVGASSVKYLDKDGRVYLIFHRTPSAATSWEHDLSDESMEACPVCHDRKGR